VSTRIAILDDGRLVALGTLDELRARASVAAPDGRSEPEASALEEVFLAILGSQA
jgi:ABC-type multidrug transport system ATPase subunit